MPSTSLLTYNYVAVNCVRLEINQIFTSNDHVFCSEVNNSRTAAAAVAAWRITCMSWQRSQVTVKYPAGRESCGFRLQLMCTTLFSCGTEVLTRSNKICLLEGP